MSLKNSKNTIVTETINYLYIKIKTSLFIQYYIPKII